jgi:putative PepSY-like beta-lactamase-inhibitor
MRPLRILLLLFITSSAFAQKKEIREKDVPPAVIQSFIKKYPEAKTRTWKTKEGEYEVDFYISQKKYEAKYETDGKWKKTSFKINEKEVPSNVMNAFKQSEYGKWSLDDSYSVENTDHKNLYLLKVMKGNNIMELLYTSNGDLLKAKSKS